ncbi:phosphatidylethanolamine-binding protein 4 [Genypterus blacodes]|uniref:phosphatidylethanolamine-binding protein 4 n=1 Tax=Genypterus blacodes TaxID=154954 RepID=UPI003F765255
MEIGCRTVSWLLLLSVCVWELCCLEATKHTLSAEDSSYCRDGLEVHYPELDIKNCLEIPKGRKLREKISTVWGAPRVLYPKADEKKSYVLMMVDPDAPRRSSPTSAHWRHWLVVDVKGGDLKKGHIHGTTLTEYFPPTPPSNTGFHRYQFMLFKQPPGTTPSLTDKENSSSGKWNLQGFVERCHLGSPVATLQFLTQNYQ